MKYSLGKHMNIVNRLLDSHFMFFQTWSSLLPTKNMKISNVCRISLVFLFLFGRMEDFSYFCTPTITH